MLEWIILIGLALFAWFVLPKLPGFIGDLANIIKLLLKIGVIVFGILVILTSLGIISL